MKTIEGPKTEVTEFCERNAACHEGATWASQYATLAEVWDNCPRGDWLWWMARRAGIVIKPLSVRVAIACAEHVLPKYETRHPGDDRPRKAIEAAKTWLSDPSEENRRAAYAAATAAYAAADAYAAANAANAADAAAAYDAAATAAYAADAAAAYDAAYAERKWQADKIREIVGTNPFAKEEK